MTCQCGLVKQATQGYVGGIPVCCGVCKKDGMIHFYSVQCKFTGCLTRASYNFKGLHQKFCAKHKEPDMINVNAKRCIYEDCDKIPSFNYSWGTNGSLYCTHHKKEGMVNHRSKHCIAYRCFEKTTHGYKGMKSCYCSVHKTKDMVEIIESKKRSVEVSETSEENVEREAKRVRKN